MVLSKCLLFPELYLHTVLHMIGIIMYLSYREPAHGSVFVLFMKTELAK